MRPEGLESILESAAFRKAPLLRNLLVYLWEHQGQPISEYAVAVDALGRPPDFDPRVDAGARVIIARLRNRLKEYYKDEGARCTLRLDIPLGSHELRIEYQEPPGPIPLPAPARPRPRTAVLLAAGIALGFAAGLLPRAPAPAERPALPPFWRNFFSSGKPTNLFIPTPVFFQWPNSNLRARDVQLNDFSRWEESPLIDDLARRHGPPSLLQTYTVGPDTFAAVRLAQYLEARGVHVSVVGTSALALDSVLDHNTIFLGVPGTSRHLVAILDRLNFFTPMGKYEVVGNRSPRPGEPAEFRQRALSTRRAVKYGIVALVKGRAPDTKILALAGLSTDAMVSFLSAPSGLQQLEDRWRREGSPPFFEVVVEAETDGDTVLGASLVVFRPTAATY